MYSVSGFCGSGSQSLESSGALPRVTGSCAAVSLMETIVILGSLVFAMGRKLSCLVRTHAAGCLELWTICRFESLEPVVILGSLVFAADLKESHLV